MKAVTIWLAVTVTAWAAAGIPLNQPFDVPLSLDGKAAVGKAVIVESADAAKPLWVFYVGSDGKLATLTYTITRGTVPDDGDEDNDDGDDDDVVPPPPPPPPVPTVLWGIVVEESADRTPEQAIVLTSKVVRALFADGGDLQVVDDDVNPAADIKPYLDRAKGKVLPQLYLVDDAGVVHFEGAMPATVEAFVTLVESKRRQK